MEPATTASCRPFQERSFPDIPLGRWLLGTAAAGATASVEAGTVQIDLTGNGVTFAASVLDDQTYRDLTGDGIDDLVGSSNLGFTTHRGGNGIIGAVAGARVGAFFTRSSNTSTTFVAFVGTAGDSDGQPTYIRNFIPITFSDARINEGAATRGFIEVFANNLSDTSHEIQLVRLVFDDENTDLQEKVYLGSVYSPWYDVSIQSQPVPTKSLGNGRSAKQKLKRQIAALEAQIRKVKTSAGILTPRMTYLRANPATVRLLSSLERRLNALKQQLRRL
jgi:hypothetical protein